MLTFDKKNHRLKKLIKYLKFMKSERLHAVEAEVVRVCIRGLEAVS